MAISKRIRRQKRNRPKRSSKGTITIGTISPDTERKKEKAIRTKMHVKQDMFIKNMWVITIIRNDGLHGLTTVSSKETPTREHPLIKQLLKNLQV